MIGDNLKSVKFIGRRDMNMDTNIFNWKYKYDSLFYPYFNDAKELFRILF